DGLTPATAWKTVAKVNSSTFAPGSQILFQAGGAWHESLVASSSGTTDAPIVYGSYGTGSKPAFWGSDVAANQYFSVKLAGTTSPYMFPRGSSITAILVDHQFLHDASTLTGSTDPAVTRAYVDATPNSWTNINGNIYVNTGGSNPKTDGRTYTTAVRE